MDEIVLMGDARVAAVPVEPLDDPLVDLREDFATSDLKDDDDNPRFSWVRAGLAERLLAARAHLPDGYSLQVVEGLRPAVLQDRYFTSYRDGLRAADPRLSDEESFLLASRYVSPPAVAPHVSGAAIDLTLLEATGRRATWAPRSTPRRRPRGEPATSTRPTSAAPRDTTAGSWPERCSRPGW